MRPVTWVFMLFGAVMCFMSYWPLFGLGLRLPWITFFQIITGFATMLIASAIYDRLMRWL